MCPTCQVTDSTSSGIEDMEVKRRHIHGCGQAPSCRLHEIFAASNAAFVYRIIILPFDRRGSC
jgi:hypothetical protein